MKFLQSFKLFRLSTPAKVLFRQEAVIAILQVPVFTYILSVVLPPTLVHPGFFIRIALAAVSEVIVNIIFKKLTFSWYGKAQKELEKDQPDTELMGKAKKAAFSYPVIDALWMLRIFFFVNLIVFFPWFFIESAVAYIVYGNLVLTALLLVTLPIFFSITEKECARFLGIPVVESIHIDTKKLLKISLGFRLLFSIICSVLYPFIMLATLMAYINAGIFAIEGVAPVFPVLFISAVLLPVIVAVLLVSNIKNSLNEMSGVMKSIVKGKGDLSVRVVQNTNDELGYLGHYFNEFMAFMNSMINDIRQVSEKTAINSLTNAAFSDEAADSLNKMKDAVEGVKVRTGELNDEINRVSDQAQEVARFISELADLIKLQSADIDESASSIRTMAKSIKQVAGVADEQQKKSSELLQLAEEGGKEMDETINAIIQVSESIGVIRKMMKIINKIAAQTNMLAMNAAIEAAHAGEMGQGFSVVAGEIRELAEDTSKNAKEISGALKGITESIERSGESTKHTGAIFSNIVTGVEKMTNAIGSIHHSTSELSSNSQDISTVLTRLLEKTEGVEKNSSDMEEQIRSIADFIGKMRSVSGNTYEKTQDIVTKISQVWDSLQQLSDVRIENAENIAKIEGLVKQFNTEV
ncbi:MAG: methyl-accepting chemotaxis protein [Spirochaetia bacterium]